MRILVTGGAGFIGSHIVEQLLSHGHEPVVLDDLSTGRRENVPPDVPLHCVNVCDPEALAKSFEQIRPEVVCHQAAQLSVGRSVREPSFDAKVNIMGLLNVLEQCVRWNVSRLVFASSGGVLYGDVYQPADEHHPCNPISPYGISKWAGELYLRFFTSEHGLKTCALRYSNVYGPRQDPYGEAGVVAIFAENMLRGEQTVINGDGRYDRDYVYVGDVARANLLALTGDWADDHVALNIGTGRTTDVNQLAGHLQQLASELRGRAGEPAEVPAPRYGPARPGDLRSNLVSAARAKETLGWQPQIGLEEGLRRTVDWFAEQPKSGSDCSRDRAESPA